LRTIQVCAVNNFHSSPRQTTSPPNCKDSIEGFGIPLKTLHNAMVFLCA
jgi:hypothetical protein